MANLSVVFELLAVSFEQSNTQHDTRQSTRTVKIPSAQLYLVEQHFH